MPNAVTVLLLLSSVMVVLAVVAGFSSRGRALRPLPKHSPEDAVVAPGADTRLFERWYIESLPGQGPVHSCSFVEFDERGDYLDFSQHRQAYLKIMELGEAATPLTVVIYVHGWRHNGQSHDVLAFNEFLHQLASAHDDDQPRRRIHGVYLAWRGASLRSPVPNDKIKKAVDTYFGGPTIDPARAARVPLFNAFLESLGYFNRKSVPEHKFAGTCLARTVFTCGFAAKRTREGQQVLLMGHSFGGLMLERAFQNAAIGQLTEKWPFDHPDLVVAATNPLPFDSVLILNSAAPSIYAKQFQSYLAAHRQAMVKKGVPSANTPFIFSLTSEADWATGKVHPIANSLCILLPTLWRNYHGDDFILAKGAASDSTVIRQSYYYRHTPGHNPLLVNRFIERVNSGSSGDVTAAGYVRYNLKGLKSDPAVFRTMDARGQSLEWRINFPPATQNFDHFSMYRSFRPVAWMKDDAGHMLKKETAYWIIRCPKEIIAGHNDIWSQSAMDTYAALHRIALDAGTAQRDQRVSATSRSL